MTNKAVMFIFVIIIFLSVSLNIVIIRELDNYSYTANIKTEQLREIAGTIFESCFVDLCIPMPNRIECYGIKTWNITDREHWTDKKTQCKIIEEKCFNEWNKSAFFKSVWVDEISTCELTWNVSD